VSPPAAQSLSVEELCQQLIVHDGQHLSEEEQASRLARMLAGITDAFGGLPLPSRVRFVALQWVQSFLNLSDVPGGPDFQGEGSTQSNKSKGD
jgi:hypothetical protein